MSEPRALPAVSDLPAALTETVDAVREAVTAIAVAKLRLEIDTAELAELNTAVEELHVVEDEMAAEVAELQAMERERGAGRHLTQLLLGAMPVPLLVTNPEGAVLDATSAAADLLHIRAGELHRKPLFAFIAAHSRRCGRTLLSDAVRTGEVVEATIDIHPRDGADVPCHVTVVPDPVTGDGWPTEDPADGRPGRQPPAQLVRWLVRPLAAGGAHEIAYRAAVVELCTLGVAAGDLRSQLKRVAELASDGIPAVDAASVLLGDPAEPELVATSSAIAQAGDGVQHLAADGPTFDAYRLNRTTGSSDLCEDPRLGATGEPGVAEVHSCLAFPLMVDDAAVGVVTLYAAAKDALNGADDVDVELSRPFVLTAQALVRDSRAVAEIVKVRDQLQEALRYRGVIEQAKGMIMLARGCSADDAFSVLVRMSNVRNTKLRDVASEFVDNGGRLERRGTAAERGKPERVRPDRSRTDRFSPPRSSRSVPRKPPAPPA